MSTELKPLIEFYEETEDDLSGNKSMFKEVLSYLMYTMFDVLISLWLYQNTLFITLQNQDLQTSQLTLLGCLLFFLLIEFVMDLYQGLEEYHTSRAITNGLGVYMVLSYLPMLSTNMKVVLLGCGCVAVLLFLLCWLKRIKNISWETLFESLKKVLNVFMIGFWVIYSGIGWNYCTKGSYLVAHQPVQENETFNQHLDEFSTLCLKEYDSLNFQERLDFFQKFVNDVAYEYGVPYPLSLGAAPLDGNVLGNYSSSIRSITLDIKHVMEDECYDVMNTVLHEVYHAYQYCMVDLYDKVASEDKELMLFHFAKQYQYETDHYLYLTKIEGLYDELILEQMAYLNAEVAVDDYYDKMEMYQLRKDYDSEVIEKGTSKMYEK